MNKKLKKLITCGLVAISLLNTSVKTYASDIMFTNSTIKDGLSQSTIQALFQDSDGYIWIGTGDGLNKYNGYEFKKYNRSVNSKNSIINGFISTINEDKNKNLWVGTVDGISKIDLEDGTIKNYTSEKNNLPSSDILSIEVDDEGRVFIASARGLSIYDEETDEFILLADGDKFDSDGYINIIKASDHDSIYGVMDGFIFEYNYESSEFTQINIEEINNTVNTFSIDKNILWIGTNSSGLYKYNIDTGEIEDVKRYYKNEKDCYSIKDICIDKDNNILVGTENGLVVYDTFGNEKIYTCNFYDKYTLVNNTIYNILQDSSGLIWLGTYTGLSIFNPNDGISYYFSTPGSSTGLPGNLIHGVYEDVDGKLWIGSYNEGLTIFDRANDTYEYITVDSENKLSSNIVADITGNEEKVFVATDYGVNIFDRETMGVEYIIDELSGTFCNNLYLDGDNLWVGTEGGVNIINLKDKTVKNLNDLFEYYEIEEYLTNCIYKDSEGIFWLGMLFNGGVIKYDPNTGESKIYRHHENENSISDSSIASINEDSEGNIWIGTMNGLNKLNKETEEFTVFSTENGLFNNNIYSILFDNDGKMWISTNLGIGCLEIDGDKIITVKEYVKDNEFNSNAHVKTKNGEIVFGGVDGLFIIDPQKIKVNDNIPDLQFDSFKVNGIEVDNLEDVSIGYKDTSVTIKLFTTMYDDPDGTKYFYKISDEWLSLEGNEITFSNLAPGKYDVEFKALNTNGEYSDTESITFKVDPPFWSSVYAKIIYISVVIILMIFIYRKIKYMDETIESRNYQLGKEMAEKNKLLLKVLELEKKKNSYLVNLSHELRTPLNVISSIVQLVTSLNEDDKVTKGELRRYMDMSKKNVDRLLKLINDLMDSSKIDAGSYKLFLEENNLVYVVEDAVLSLKNLVEQKGINLIFDTEVEECIMKFDVDAIERCIVNIVNNAVKFTESGGEIEVYLSEYEDVVKIDIKDTGCGIPEDKLEDIFDRFNQGANSKKEASIGSGLGLTITKRLITLHKGEILVSSEIGKGSTFTIILPKVIKE